MNKDDENSNENWVHVDAYTRDDGTHVSEYWRRRPGGGWFSNTGFLNKKYSNDIPNTGFTSSNTLGRINAPYNYQLGGMVPPYLQFSDKEVEHNYIGMDEEMYKPLLSYLPTDNLGQNANTNKLISGVNYSPADLEHYIHQCTTDNMNWFDKKQEDLYVNYLGSKEDKYKKSHTAFLNNAVNDFEDAKNNPNAIVYDSGASIPDVGLRKFITTDANITDNGKIDVKNMRGAYYNANSSVSESIAHDPAITEYIRKEYGNLICNGKKVEEYQEKLKNKKLPDNVKENFKSEFIAKGNVNLRSFANKGDIAHCTLYNPHIDKNEHFKAQVIDIVDYENRKYYGGYGYGYIPNQWGYKMQQMGMIENVFHVVDIDIPLNEIYKSK